MSSKAIITVSFLIIALSIAYYLVIFLPSKERGIQQIELQKATSEQLVEDDKKQTYSQCEKDASKAAVQTLKSKAELLPEGKLKTTLEEAASKNMYYKDDYNSYYENCLKRNGLSN